MKKKTYLFPEGTTISAFHATDAFCIYNTNRIEKGMNVILYSYVYIEESGRTFVVEMTVKEI